MNKQLKLILISLAGIGQEIAKTELPFAGLLIDGITILVDKDKSNNIEAISKISDGFVQALNAIKDEQVVSPYVFHQGVAELEAALVKIKSSFRS